MLGVCTVRSNGVEKKAVVRWYLAHEDDRGVLRVFYVEM